MAQFKLQPWQKAGFAYGVGLFAGAFQGFILFLTTGVLDLTWGAYAATAFVSISLFDMASLWVEHRTLTLTAAVVLVFAAFCGVVFVAGGIGRGDGLVDGPGNPQWWLTGLAAGGLFIDAAARAWETYAELDRRH